jgi:hypothetical protein
MDTECSPSFNVQHSHMYYLHCNQFLTCGSSHEGMADAPAFTHVTHLADAMLQRNKSSVTVLCPLDQCTSFRHHLCTVKKNSSLCVESGQKKPLKDKFSNWHTHI